MIEVDQLTKHYGSFTAVNGISFRVDQGEILGFLGPNGAGKSTTMKMLTGFITPSAGTARIGGKDILQDSIEVRKLVGYLPESAPSYKSMTVFEFLRFIAEVRGFSKQQGEQKLQHVVEITGLEKVGFQTIETLSKGYKQRVGFAQALIHDPPVLILDEPTDGLDPNQKHEVRKLIKAMSKEKVIVLSTHILEEMEAVCSRAIIINQGNIVADGSPATLLTQSSTYNVVTLILNQTAEASMLETIERHDKVAKVERGGISHRPEVHAVHIFPQGKANILADINQLVTTHGWSIAEIHQEKGQMDEVFRNLTLGASN